MVYFHALLTLDDSITIKLAVAIPGECAAMHPANVIQFFIFIVICLYDRRVWACVGYTTVPPPFGDQKIVPPFLGIQRRAHQSVRITLEAAWSIISQRAKLWNKSALINAIELLCIPLNSIIFRSRSGNPPERPLDWWGPSFICCRCPCVTAAHRAPSNVASTQSPSISGPI